MKNISLLEETVYSSGDNKVVVEVEAKFDDWRFLSLVRWVVVMNGGLLFDDFGLKCGYFLDETR